MANFRTLDGLDVKGKRILLRVDLNVPLENGVVTDATRIERAAPAITELADAGGKVILLSHFGRPKGKREPKDSLKPVAAEVARVVKRPVKFVDDCVGDVAEKAVAAMKPGDIVCLENTRFHPGEEKNDPAFVKQLARLGDGTHLANMHLSLSRARARDELERALALAGDGSPLIFGGDLNLRDPVAPGLEHVAARDVDHVFVRGCALAGEVVRLDRGLESGGALSDHEALLVPLAPRSPRSAP